MFGVQNDANNFGYSAGLLANTIANRPIRAALGTLFVSTDTLLLYRWTGSAWVEISAGGGTITGAFNGCQEQANEIGLGGELSEATDIITKDFPISFYAHTTATVRFSVTNDAAVSELAMFTSVNAANDGGIYIGNFEIYGTIQSKEYAGQTPTELRLNYDGGNIQLGNGDLGMYFDTNSGNIRTTSGNDVKGLKLDFASTTYSLGDFDGINNGNSIKIFDADDTIQIYSNQGFYNFSNIPSYANNAAAISGGLNVGDIYRGTTGGGDTLHIVH